MSIGGAAAIHDHARHLTQLQAEGFCVLSGCLSRRLLSACRVAFWPILLAYISRHKDRPNRGPHRHCLPMPFEPPCFAPEFFFDTQIIAIVRAAMDDRIVADQWSCDVPLTGSLHQEAHVDYERPLFTETPDLLLPTYMLAVSFGLDTVTSANGAIEIAPGTHRLQRQEALRLVASGEIPLLPVPLNTGDVLIRHPWALHRGTPNQTTIPRALLTIRYVRRWYSDNSRDANAIPLAVWQALKPQQRELLRFSIGD